MISGPNHAGASNAARRLLVDELDLRDDQAVERARVLVDLDVVAVDAHDAADLLQPAALGQLPERVGLALAERELLLDAHLAAAVLDRERRARGRAPDAHLGVAVDREVALEDRLAPRERERRRELAQQELALDLDSVGHWIHVPSHSGLSICHDLANPTSAHPHCARASSA